MHAPSPLYYLLNFHVLVDHARRTYSDLLTQDEQRFIAHFTALTVPAQCLYVRMLTRRAGPLRADQLRYAEIPDVAAAAVELAERELLDIDPATPAAALLQLLTLPELVPLLAVLPASVHRSVTRGARKHVLIAALATAGDDAVQVLLSNHLQWYCLRGQEVVDTLSLLFFGNRQQDLSTFVITELGHLQFEQYALDGMRQFLDRQDFDAWRAWLDRADDINCAVASRDIAGALAAAQYCLTHSAHRLAPWRRDRLLARLTRFFETENCSELALTLAAATVDSDDARQRARLIRKRRGERVASPAQLSPPPVVERDLPLPAWQAGAAEALVLDALCTAGYRGVHLENQFPCALFGLLCWDILFMSVPGAFFNAYQLGPLDLFTPEFGQRRAAALEERIAAIRAEQDDWRQRLTATFAAKYGIANHFVAWRYLEPTQFSELCAALSGRLAALICERMAADPRRFRRGFPDLVLLAPGGDLQFCEVKSPNDQLSTPQRDWLGFLRAQGSEAWVARIVVPSVPHQLHAAR